MMHSYIKKLICALLTAALLSVPTFTCTAENIPPEYDVRDKTIDEIVADFMAEFRLSENNFAMGWYNTGTGETWYFNENQYMVAGSMYKLPLAMNYIDKFADGTFDPEATTGGNTLSHLIDRAIRYSDNDAADLLRKYYSPNFMTYRFALANYSDVEQDALPPSFFSTNSISPHIMLDTLKVLYADEAFYHQIIDDMLLAHPGYYFKKYQGEYEIAHKYGYYEGALNDCGIFFTPTPFLLVAFTNNAANCETAIGVLAKRMTDYSLWLQSEAERLAAEAEAAERARLAAEQAAEEARIATEQAAARIAAEMEAAEKALAEQAAAAIATAEAAEAAEIARRQQLQETKRMIAVGGTVLLVIAAALVFTLLKKRRRIGAK